MGRMWTCCGNPPSDVKDGTLVYEGQEESCIHDELTNGIEYLYTAYKFDEDSNYSAGQTESAIPHSPKFTQEMTKLLAPDILLGIILVSQYQ